MNLNRILVVSFLILMISTYQTDSGIIFSLLLKVLLLKGALFMTMPLSIGAFMMGQGMGFFAGNMMGGYMMLRAANRYHHTEKDKWTSSGYGTEAPSYGHSDDYVHEHVGHHYGSGGGWKSNKYYTAFDKGKDIGSALHSLADHKSKLAAAFYKVKSLLGHKKPAPAPYHGKYKGWGWSNPGPSYQHYSPSSPSASYGHHDNDDYGYHHHSPSPSKYKSVTKPITKVKFNPYGHLTSVGAKSSSSGGYRSKGYSGSGYSPSVAQTNYANNYPVQPSYHHHQEDPSSLSSVHSDYATVVAQDPSNTYYTSAYDGPGHEYTGMLTDTDLLAAYNAQSDAQEKSSSEDDSLIYKDVTVKPSSLHDLASTISPNPILEKYLEQRLQEEASKQKSVEQKLEAQQLIQMLRKAYLKQLVDSLKEEEKIVVESSTENSSGRGSRSIEDYSKNNIIDKILSYKFFPFNLSGEGSQGTTDNTISDRASHNIFDESTTSTTSSSTTTKNISGSNSTLIQLENSQIEISSSTEPSHPSSSSEAYILNTTPTESDILDHSQQQQNEGSFEPSTTTSTSTTENGLLENYFSSSTEKSLSSFLDDDGDFSLDDLNEMPAMWVKLDGTIKDEHQPVMIRLKRGAGATPQHENAPKAEAQIQGQSVGDTEQQINSFVDDIKKFFTLLNVLDQDQCLQKLVCDVHTNQKPIAALTQYEQNLLTTFRLMKALMPEGEEDSTTKYRRAALIGETGQSLELCQQSYSSCEYSSSQIISLGSQAEASASDWEGAKASVSGSGRSNYVTMPRVRRSLRSFYL